MQKNLRVLCVSVVNLKNKQWYFICVNWAINKPSSLLQTTSVTPQLSKTLSKTNNLNQQLQRVLANLENINFRDKDFIANNINYIVFLAFLAAIYIANARLAERNIRQANDYKKELQELRWKYMTDKSDLMIKSKQTEVSKAVNDMGLRDLTAPPPKLMVKPNE